MKIMPFLLIGFLSPVLWAQETTVVYQEALEHQKHMQALERKLQEYKLKLELARTLKDSLATGLVDFEGNLHPEAPPVPKLDLILGEADKKTEAAASAIETSLISPRVSLPVLVAIRGKKAIFSTLSGMVVEGKVGSRLPGEYVIKEIRLTEVVLESDGNRFVTKLNWGGRTLKKATPPRFNEAQRIL